MVYIFKKMLAVLEDIEVEEKGYQETDCWEKGYWEIDDVDREDSVQSNHLDPNSCDKPLHTLLS